MKSNLSGVQIPTAAKLNIDGEFTLDASAGTSGQLLISQGSGNTPAWTSAPNLSSPLLTRIDSTSEGGQIDFARSSDNTGYWHIDSFGTGGTPSGSAQDLRFIENATVRLKLTSGGTFDINNNTAVIGGTSVDLLNTTTTTLNFAGAVLNLTIADTALLNSTRTIDIGASAVTQSTQNINIGASSMSTAAQTISIGTDYSGSTTNLYGVSNFIGTAFINVAGTSTPNPGNAKIVAQQSVFSQANSSSSQNTTQSVFPAAYDTLSSLQAASLYRFRAKYYSAFTYSATSGAINILFAFTNAPAEIRYSFKTYPQVAGTTVTQHGASSVTTATTIVPTQAASGSWVTEIDGFIKSHATLTSTFIPQFICTASTSSSAVIQSGSYFEIEKLGASSVTNVSGNWA